MKKKLLSMIVAVVFVMVSLLSTSVTVFAQSEEVERKVLEVLTAIDEKNQSIEKAVVMPEKLRNVVQIIGEDEGLESAKALGFLEHILKYVQLVDQFNNEPAREDGIIGVVQAYSNYASAIRNLSESSMTENDIENARNAAYNMSKVSIQAASDEMGNVIIGMLSGTSEISKMDALEKIGELAVIVKIVTEFEAEFQAGMEGLQLPSSSYSNYVLWEGENGRTYCFMTDGSTGSITATLVDGYYYVQKRAGCNTKFYYMEKGEWILEYTHGTEASVSFPTTKSIKVPISNFVLADVDGNIVYEPIGNIIAVHNKLHENTQWKAYLESKNIDIPDLPTSTPTVTPTVAPTVTPTSKEPVEIVKGDIDGNGVFNAIDFANMRMFLMGSKTLSDQQLKAADVDSNGVANAIDFAIMRQVILGMKAAFD